MGKVVGYVAIKQSKKTVEIKENRDKEKKTIEDKKEEK